jgi:hypothetical protein
MCNRAASRAARMERERLLGHRSIQHTVRYTELSSDRLKMNTAACWRTRLASNSDNRFFVQPSGIPVGGVHQRIYRPWDYFSSKFALR